MTFVLILAALLALIVLGAVLFVALARAAERNELDERPEPLSTDWQRPERSSRRLPQ